MLALLPAWQVDTQALLLTLKLATVTTALLLMIAVPLAGWLSLGAHPVLRGGRSRRATHPARRPGGSWAFGSFAGASNSLRPVVETLAMLPLVLPPTVLGFYLLVLLGPHAGAGRLLTRLVGHPLAFSFEGLVVGSVLYSLPFALQPLTAGFAQVPAELVEASALLGAGPLRTLVRVVVPLARRSLLAAAGLSFAHTVGEFGVVLMLGGDIPGRTRTLSIALLDQVQDGRYEAANQTALLLLVGSALVLLIVYAGQRSPVRRQRGWPGSEVFSAPRDVQPSRAEGAGEREGRG